MATSVELLYPIVSEAIRRAEILQDLNAPGAADAFLDVSLLEERIAEALPASDPEGALARRGAVRAALSAGERARARALLDRYLGETNAKLEELEALRNFYSDGSLGAAALAAIGYLEALLSRVRELRSQLSSFERRAARSHAIWVDDEPDSSSNPVLQEAELELSAVSRHISKLSALMEKLEAEQLWAHRAGRH